MKAWMATAATLVWLGFFGCMLRRLRDSFWEPPSRCHTRSYSTALDLRQHEDASQRIHQRSHRPADEAACRSIKLGGRSNSHSNNEGEGHLNMITTKEGTEI